MRGAVFLRAVRLVALAAAALAGVASTVSAQATTQAYPWRLSYFPYVTASPNDGLMPMGRVVWFQASRWDARTSVDRQVAIEGGYSTKNAWLVRVQGDFPRLAPGWRLQAIVQAEHDADFVPDQSFVARANRQLMSVDLTRRVRGRFYLALRGDAMHLKLAAQAISPPEFDDGSFPAETDYRGRVAAVLDLRDRGYDTRTGLLLQTGLYAGSAGGGYHAWYGLASGWHPFSSRTRITARVGARAMSLPDSQVLDAPRILPAWEDEFVVLGGPESNRALAIGEQRGRGLLLGSMELRHDVLVVAGAAVAVIAFVDAGRAFNDMTSGPGINDTLPRQTGALQLSLDRWTLGVGGGVALRLLRNAVLTATVGVAHGDARVYVSSGWSW
jgi:hypothetical protein